MNVLRRGLGIAASTGVGLCLVWLLFRLLPVTPGEAIVAALSGPLWLYAAVITLTFSNLVVGALKWQVAADYLARPTDRPSLRRMVELTSLGEFFGQVIPVQLSTLLVRWMLMDRETRASGYVARATFFEQTLDLILVLAGSAAAVTVIAFGFGALPALATLAGLVAVSLLALRSCLGACARTFAVLARRGYWRGMTAPASEGFAHASAAPARVLAALGLYSLLRLILVGLRAAAVFAFFAPMTPSWLVFVASPPVALLTTLPISPAGLGVAEWTWSAVLVHGGTAAAVAAVGALALRLTNIVALCVIVGGLVLVRRLEERRSEPRVTRA